MKNLASKKISYRFPLWLTVIFLTLFSVPLFVLMNLILLAKIFGLVSLLVVIIALRVWLRITRLNSNREDRVILNRNVIFDLERNYPFLINLKSNQKKELYHRTGLILAEARFISGNQFLDFSKATDIAFNVAILMFGLPYLNLKGLVVQLNAKSTSQFEILHLGDSIDFSHLDKSRGIILYRKSLLDSNFGQKLKESILRQFQFNIK
jgi:hypothetical protein